MLREDEEDSVRADTRASAAEPANRLGLKRAFLDARPEDQEVVSRSAHLRECVRQRAERWRAHLPGHFAVPIALSLPDLSTAVTPYSLAKTPASK